MTSVGSDVKNMVSLVAFGVAISSCFILGIVFNDITAWATPHQHTSQFVKTDKATSRRVVKRAAEHTHVFDYNKHCVVASPSKQDIQKLCEQECDKIHCLVSCYCDNGSCQGSPSTTCTTKACSQFKVNDLANDVTLEEKGNTQVLSGIVNNYLLRNGNINNIEVKCSDHNAHLLNRKLETEITKNNFNECNSIKMAEKSNSVQNGDYQMNQTGSNIYLFYFRFISRWESFVKFPKLNSLIEHTRKDTSWDVNSFGNLQTQNLVLDDNLLSLLGAASTSTNKTLQDNNGDLLQLAIDTGHCVLFNALACHKSQVYTEIQSTLTNEDNIQNCHLNKKDNVDISSSNGYMNQTLCNSNKFDMNIENDFFIHDQFGQILPTNSSKLFSIFLINIPDMISITATDSAITELMAQILTFQSATLILISDVGDPKFSRFDNSIFLRTQTFNPFLHVFISRLTSHKHPALAPLISDLKVNDLKFSGDGMSDAYILTRALLLEEKIGNEVLNSNETRINNISGGNFREKAKFSVVRCVEKIKGPIECICQGVHVQFSNDSLQVAFASLVIGNLNNKFSENSKDSSIATLQHSGRRSLDSSTKFPLSHSTCDRLHGLAFSNVQHVLWNKTTYVLMTLYLKPATLRYSHVVLLDAEVEYSTQDGHISNVRVNILSPTKISLDTMFDSVHNTSKFLKQLRHLLCQQPNELNQEVASHKAVLTFLLSEKQFGVKAKSKVIHHPCLYLVTRNFGDSSAIEAINICYDRVYDLSVGAEFINTLSFPNLPLEVTIGPGQIRFLSSLIKRGYWVSKSAYKIKTSYTVNML